MNYLAFVRLPGLPFSVAAGNGFPSPNQAGVGAAEYCIRHLDWDDGDEYEVAGWVGQLGSDQARPMTEAEYDAMCAAADEFYAAVHDLKEKE